MLNLPFIFVDEKSKLPNEWGAMVKLLQIMQMVHSNYITEIDVNHLEKLVKDHLLYITELGFTLLPKHHLPVIRRMGPLVLISMMKAESKHKVSTDIADNTHNFVNLPKTMGEKHQIRLIQK